MTTALRRAIEREKASTGPEHVGPIVRRVVEDLNDRSCAQFILSYLDNPVVSSLYGEPVES